MPRPDFPDELGMVARPWPAPSWSSLGRSVAERHGCRPSRPATNEFELHGVAGLVQSDELAEPRRRCDPLSVERDDDVSAGQLADAVRGDPQTRGLETRLGRGPSLDDARDECPLLRKAVRELLDVRVDRYGRNSEEGVPYVAARDELVGD
jgi:hypothetical protein